MTAAARTAALSIPLDVGSTSPAVGSAELLGGKGAALARLVAAGLPVPRCEVLTTESYLRAVAQPALQALVTDLSRGGNVPDAEIDAAFLAADLPAVVADAVAAVLSRLGPEAPLAVRSSATTEDLGSASFAGQYRSFLDVAGAAAVERAIRLVWASLWHRAPRTYRHFHGFVGDVAMAVVVMAMVPARRAGVAFSRDPGGSPDRVRVEAVAGLAEGLVSGAVTPQCHLLARDDLHRAAPPVPIGAAGEVALRCEELFGAAQDVEWAWDGQRMWVVQSRPITTAAAPSDDDGFDSAVGRNTRYTTAGIGEMLPGVLPALRWASASFLLEEGFRQVCDTLRALPADMPQPEHFVVRVRGRAAMNLDALSDVATALPGGTPQDLEQQYFGAADPAAADALPPRRRWRLPGHDEVGHDLRVVMAHRRARREASVVARAADALLDAAPEPSGLDDAALLAWRARVLELSARAMSAELAVAAAAAAAYGRLEATLCRHLGASGATWAQVSTSAVAGDTVPMRAARLGRRIGDTCPAALEQQAWPAARDRLAANAPALAEEVVQLARRSGSKAVFAGPTWDEDLTVMWSVVRAGAARAAPAHADFDQLARLESALVSRRGWRRTRVLTGQVVDVRLHLVRALLAEACELLSRRELAKGAVLALGGVVRRADVEAGHRLAVRGLLGDPADVEHLTVAELRSALLTGRAPAPDAVDSRRRCVSRWRAEDELPLLFTGRPAAVAGRIPSGPQLRGWGASPGRHTGRVRVLAAPDDAVVERGDVVVARRTDAAWSPVLMRAGAIVVEQGGPLSHAAIVARELGLPAVVNVPGAVARLRAADVTQVTVDGDEGLVVVRAAAAARGEVPA